jgi:hypothetical protein
VPSPFTSVCLKTRVVSVSTAADDDYNQYIEDGVIVELMT